MTGTLRVTPEKLIAEATEFQQAGSNVNTLTQNMLQTVSSLKTTWAGEANTAFDTKFRQLEDDMAKMLKMINEHSKDLQEMAKNYQAAESTNVNSANSLSGDAIS